MDRDLSGLSTIILPLDNDDHINNLADVDDDTFMSGTIVPTCTKKQY